MSEITICVPTWNGGRFLRDALQNIIDQSYTDFVVIISDNSSTDDTADIAKEFAAKDRRFTYLKQPTFLTAVGHMCSLPRLATTPYVIWHSDDDLWAPNYLETLIGLLRSQPSAKLAVGKAVDEWMDDSHRKVETPFRPIAQRPTERMKAALSAPAPWVYGLYETKEFVKVMALILDRHHLDRGWDHLLILYYCMRGLIVGSNDTYFVWRRYIDQSLERQRAGTGPITLKSSRITGLEKLRRKIEKVDYLIEARRRFLAVAGDLIPSNGVEYVAWRLFLWHFAARRIYPARKALKYKAFKLLSGGK